MVRVRVSMVSVDREFVPGSVNKELVQSLESVIAGLGPHQLMDQGSRYGVWDQGSRNGVRLSGMLSPTLDLLSHSTTDQIKTEQNRTEHNITLHNIT